MVRAEGFSTVLTLDRKEVDQHACGFRTLVSDGE